MMSNAFPKGFLWGTATAAHQVEGNNIHSDWWDWEKLPGKVKKNEQSGIACDHWGRFEEDLALMCELGTNAYRFSIEWAKIEPRRGEFDSSAIEHYRKVIGLLEAAGIEPLITLHHFTSPRWWADLGYWAWEGTEEAFSGYAKLIIREIAPNATYFTTVNEPMVHLGGAYVVGLTPPQKKGFEHLRAPLLGLLRAHAAAYRTLHAEAASRGRPVRVGMAHHLRIFDPKRAWNPIDRFVATTMDRAFNWTIPTALETGRVTMKIPGLVRIDETIPGLAGTQDSIELNYYTRDLMTLGWKDGSIEPIPSVRPGTETNDLGWEIYPEGFLRILRETHRRIPGKPILVTENGIADASDAKRARFLKDHVEMLQRAIGEGVPLEGYFHWSFLDNFEWIEGFDPRFGLVEIDYSTLERKPRPSFRAYAELIRNAMT